MDFSLQPPSYAYADLRHRMYGAGVYACVFNKIINITNIRRPLLSIERVRLRYAASNNS